MEQQHISIELKRAEDDPPVHDPRFQEELREFAELLRLAGVVCSRREEGEYSTPELLVALAPEIGSTFAMVLMTWFQRRAARRIRVAMFDDDVDMQTAKDFESFVERLKHTYNETPKSEGGNS